MIEVRNSIICNEGFLGALGSLISSYELDVTITYSLIGLRKQISEKAQIFTEVKQKYIDELCKKDDKGNPVYKLQSIDKKVYDFTEENKKIFNEKMKELYNIEIKVDFEVVVFDLNEFPKGVLNALDMEILEDSKLFIFKKV